MKQESLESSLNPQDQTKTQPIKNKTTIQKIQEFVSTPRTSYSEQDIQTMQSLYIEHTNYIFNMEPDCSICLFKLFQTLKKIANGN